MSARRILIVAYYYPPINIIGAWRPHCQTKWLRRRGHDVTMLASVQSRHGGGWAFTRSTSRR